MSVYMIIETTVSDLQMYGEYVRQVPAIIEKFQGRYLARGGKTISLSAGWDPQRVVIIEFPALENVRACFNSAEYGRIAHLREGSAQTRALIVEGCEKK